MYVLHSHLIFCMAEMPGRFLGVPFLHGLGLALARR